MDRTNAERQRRYIQRLKERARGVSNVSNAPSDAALTQELAQAKRAAGPRPGHASASWRWRWARAQATNRELKAALEAAKSAKNPTQDTPVVREGYTQAEFNQVLAMLEAHCKSDDLNTRAAALEAVKLFKNTKGSFTDAQLRHPFAVVLHPDRNPARKPHEVCALFNRKEVSVEDQRKEQAAVQAYWAQREAEQKAKRKAQRERRKAEKAAEQKRQAGSA